MYTLLITLIKYTLSFTLIRVSRFQHNFINWLLYNSLHGVNMWVAFSCIIWISTISSYNILLNDTLNIAKKSFSCWTFQTQSSATIEQKIKIIHFVSPCRQLCFVSNYNLLEAALAIPDLASPIIKQIVSVHRW